jgi:hypothetical protein
LSLNQPLTDQQIIRLHHELLAPVAVHEIMRGRDNLDETARYTIDVMIAEFKPDTALLCIALCAAHIAERHGSYLPIAGSLGIEASRIVHEFGPAWLANVDRRLNASHESMVMDLLDQMPEDFEALADLLDATRAQMIETTESAILCEILSQNAHAFIDFLEDQAIEAAQAEHDLYLKGLEVQGNVITFPKHFRAH